MVFEYFLNISALLYNRLPTLHGVSNFPLFLVTKRPLQMKDLDALIQEKLKPKSLKTTEF